MNALEQRVRLKQLRLEFGMELAAEIVRMVLDLADFDVRAVGGFAGDFQAMRSEQLFILAVEFVAMPVTFADRGRTIRFTCESARFQDTGPRAQPRRSRRVHRSLSARAACRSRAAGSPD